MTFENYFANKGEFVNLELTLDRINSALNETEFSEISLGQVIHIAGTNGKGSTAYFINQILEKQNFNVALFTSPHITDLTERIKFNQKDINREKFDSLFNIYIKIIDKHKLSYFETLTFIALKFFETIKPDFTILETGLGGKFDSTNVINRKTPVITRISQDHTNYLSKNILNILEEKLGIIKNNKQVFIGKNSEFIIENIINKYSNNSLFFVNESDINYFKKKYPIPFNENIALANLVVNKITGNSYTKNLKLPPCRFEKIGKFIIDGAHNSNGLIKLTSNLKNKKMDIICSFTEEKDINKFLNILKKISSNIFLTTIPDNPRSIDLDNINTTGITKVKNPMDALNKAVENNKGNDILITGSLYLCAFLRKYIIRLK